MTIEEPHGAKQNEEHVLAALRKRRADLEDRLAGVQQALDVFEEPVKIPLTRRDEE